MNRRIISILCVICCVLMLFSGCKQHSEDSEQIIYYTVKNFYSELDGLIIDYNENCKNDKDKILVIEFENSEDLITRATTEIMAGKGPDIISSELFYSSPLMFEKIAKQDKLVDLNTIIGSSDTNNGINIDDYNKSAFESGVFGGKRLYIPICFSSNFLLSSQDALSKYTEIGSYESLTYETLKSIDRKIKEDSNDLQMFQFSECYLELLYDLIESKLDVFGGDFDFGGEKFRQDLLIAKEIINNNENVDEYTPFLFSNDGQIDFYMMCDYILMCKDNNDEAILTNIVMPKGEIQEFISVNKNTPSQKYDSILSFIKYILSEDVQNKKCGANIDNYIFGTSYGMGGYFPVNMNSFNKLFKNATTITYSGRTMSLSEKDVKELYNSILAITTYEFETFDLFGYYCDEVINNPVEQFLKGKISVEKFVEHLESVTKIYLDE